MQQDFPYQPGYVGELNTYSPVIAAGLERLIEQLNPALAGPVSKQRLACFQGNFHFRQIVAVEKLDGQPAIVGTANISFMPHSYDSQGKITDIPSLALGSFVVDETVRGTGVASKIWHALLEIGKANDIHCLQFTSNPSRGAAHSFYAKMGAEQVTPLVSFKVMADGTETAGNTPPFDEQFELAKGKIACVFSEAGAEQMNEQTARHIIAKCGAERFEQLIPVSGNAGEGSSVLFSVSF